MILNLLDIKPSSITPEHLVSLHNILIDHKDEVNAQKIVDIYEKLIKDEFSISFTGHFSAGKSSMINALLGEDVLPKSPIPTSGNIVEITSGSGDAHVFFNDGSSKRYPAPYDIDVIKEYCKDNQHVKKVELSTTNEIVPAGCMIVDTPGIDAADDADRLMTESSLHLADRLFYVMDYNHVQSDTNLHFLRKIQQKGIPFFVIINQVDKHNDREIPFQTFQDSVQQTFNQWEIHPESIYYSSLLDGTIEHNEFNEIKERLFSILLTERDIALTIDKSVEEVLRHHEEYLRDQYNDRLSYDDVQAHDHHLLKLTELQSVHADVMKQPEMIEQEFNMILNETLKNAYVMPAVLRDQAKEYLISVQKDFKVGVFSAKRKTEIEKERRLNAFLQPLQQNIEAAIQWKLRDKINALLVDHQLASPELLQYTKGFSMTYASDHLQANLKPGAQVNGNYVLNYTNDVSSHVKRLYRKQAVTLWEQIYKEVEDKTNKQACKYEKQMKHYEQRLYEGEQQLSAQAEFEDKRVLLQEQYHQPTPEQTAWDMMDEATERRHQPFIETSVRIEQNDEEMHDEGTEAEVSTPQQVSQGGHSVQSVIQLVDETIETIESLPGFQTLIDDLLNKKERLTNRTLTIALFGAFSAGKSSFANAVLGEGLLPSSPNPTTAVINRITPVTDEYGHGAVVVRLKSMETLAEDVISITKELSPPTTDLSGLIQWIKAQKVADNKTLDTVYQTYLHAMLIGYDESYQDLGQTITIDLEDFPNYVSDETKACFIDSVKLYYDCSLTRMGITLVDTPGADSVNARHTDVAFEYIKYADAILYVTYYNHALSRTDKDFLMQLGRVKETFELDKMFFIINAADLAESNADLQLVKNYVEEQLLQLGIRFPKVFALSSKQSLIDKMNETSLNKQMENFETAFYQFINDELPALAIQSTEWDINRAYTSLLTYREAADLNKQEKEQYRSGLHEKQAALIQVVEAADATIYEERIVQRIERQLHYVQERVSIRYHDMFKDTFNPTTISESGRKAIIQLENSLHRLIDYLGYELLQEMRAVSLRIEAYMKTLDQEVYDDFREKIKPIDTHFMLPLFEDMVLDTPAYEQALSTLDFKLFKTTLAQFKSTKAFFEQNERVAMKEDLYRIISPFMKQYVEEIQPVMEQAYLAQWNAVFTGNQQQVEISITDYIGNSLSMIGDSISLEEINQKQQRLASIINQTIIEPSHDERENRDEK